MTNTLVFLEACTRCGRVGRAYLGRRSARQTPLVCESCSEKAQDPQPSREQDEAARRRQG